ncbi:WD40 repeat-like protein [Xylaria grammica]|nr:WD40 repeat-like protein [Xylaria grammica]
MAAVRPDCFERALKRFKDTLDPNLAKKFSICTLHDVLNVCRDIQNAHGLEGKLRYMGRLRGFIEAMEHFGKVIEVFTNATEFVCFIWGPMKFLLGIARTHIDSFDKLLDKYGELGNAIPGLLHYQTTFEKYPTLVTVLGDYYYDILMFHQEALSVFNRPRWKELFHSTWKTFDSKFGPILHSLSNLRELLESEKGSAILDEVQKLHALVSNDQAEQRDLRTRESAKKHKQEISFIKEKHEYSLGTWIFQDPNYRFWSRNDRAGHGVLYCNGIPGAGKTTLMSTVIETLLDSTDSTGNKHCVAYFYFKQKQFNKQSHNSVLRAILVQLIDRDPIISDHLFMKISSMEGVNLRSTKALEMLVKTALESYPISYVVLDGLDECAPNEGAETVSWFLSLIYGGLEGTNTSLRVLFSGQRDGTLDKLLAHQPSVSLETSSHVEDIRQYCRIFCGRIHEKFKFSASMKEEIIARVADEAQGMFLYARVVMENLLNQTQLSRLRKELEPGTFPKGIEKAYERVAVRIFETSSTAEREGAMKILSWIACARRLLKWREIQSLFCIDPVEGDVDYEERRLRVSCKEICGSLVDIHHATEGKTGPEDIIKIVHGTAGDYLIQKKWLDSSLEHAKIAIFCSKYLTSEPFKYGINEDAVTAYAGKGYYALQDYTVQYWFDHFRECTKPTAMLDPKQFQEVIRAAQAIFRCYALPPGTREYHDVGSHERAAQFLRSLPKDGSERNAYFNIEFRTASIRNTIEVLRRRSGLDPAVQETLTNLHGETAAFKCAKPWCEYFTIGFENAKDRERHTDLHDLPFRCPFQHCFAFELGYDTQAKLDQHKINHHPEPEPDEVTFPVIATKKTAAMLGNQDIVRLLMEHPSAKHSYGDHQKEAALHSAVESGHLEVCRMIMEGGADINTRGGRGDRTPLHEAVMKGNQDIVQLLLGRADCKVDKTDAHWRSPLCDACALGQLTIVKLLFQTGKTDGRRSPSRHPDCCTYEAKLPTTPLGYACIQGHLAIVKYLLQKGQSYLVDEEILARATKNNHTAVVDLLLPIVAERREAQKAADKRKELFCEQGGSQAVQYLPRALGVALEYTLPHKDAVRCVRFSPDGKYLATAHRASIRIFEVNNGKECYSLEEGSFGFAGGGDIWSICFSPGGEYVAAGGDDKLVKVWDFPSRRILTILSGHTDRILSLDFAHQNQVLVSGSVDRKVRLWSTSTWTETMRLDAPAGITSVSIAFGDAFVAAGCLDGSLRVWSLWSGTEVECFKGSDGHTDSIYGVAFSPNGKNIVSGSFDKTVKMWKFTPYDSGYIKTMESLETNDSILSVAFSPDGKLIFSGSVDGKVKLWDPHKGYERSTIDGHKDRVNSVALSQTGGYFATGSEDNCARIWVYQQVDGG